ncbi:MAG: hypothetical protein ACHQ03_11205 [Candidatus Bathyarchaeia archaeon]
MTDRRLIFEYGEGFVTKKYRQFGVTLGEIQAINAAHSFLSGGELIITTTNPNNGFGSNRISIQVAMSPEIWMGKINTLLNGASYRTPQPTVIVEKEVVRIPCKYCNTLIDAFRNNTCPNCGAPLH